MTTTTTDINSGLEGVVVAATAISNVLGKKGDLSYRGQSIDHWVQQDFATVAGAVIDWPNLAIDEDLAGLLYEWGELTAQESETVLAHIDLHPMALVQGLVPLLSMPSTLPSTEGSARQKEALTGLVIAARLPHIVATMICLLYTSPSPRDATLSRMPSSA